MRFLTTLLMSFSLVVAVMAQEPPDPPPDEPPPDEMPPDPPPDEKPPDPPPDETPPDEVPPDEVPPDEDPADESSAEKIRLKLLEKDARARAELITKRIDAAKTDQERVSAISEVLALEPRILHPLVAQALLPYINPKPIKKGLQYSDGVHMAVLEGLKEQKFDETYYGLMKSIKDNATNLPYVSRIVVTLGDIKNRKAIPELAKMMADKRDGREDLGRIATTALGVIGHRDAIPYLIKELEEEDKAGRGDTKAVTRRERLNKIVIEALKAITGQDFKLGSEWRAWWNKNMDTFQKEKKVPGDDEGGEGNGG